MKKFLQAIAGSALLALLMLFAVPAHASTTYTVYCDISNMGDNKWTAATVCAYVSDSTSSTTVGCSSNSNDVITFNFTVDYTPTTIIFKNGSSGTNQTKEATFADGTTYFIDSSYAVTTSKYTVYCDVSNMDGTKWDNSNIHAHIWDGSNNNTTWPGGACTSYNGDVFTFTFNTSWTPTGIIFNGGSGGTQTVDLAFENGKTYYIGSKNSEGKYVLYSTTISNDNISSISVVPSTTKNTGVFDAFDLTYDTNLEVWTGTFTPNTSNTSGYASFTIKATDKSGNSYEWGPSKGSDGIGYWVTEAMGSVKTSDPYYQGGLTYGASYTFYLRANSTDITNFDWKIAATVKADVHLPYRKSDFSEPKYFLVGPRMGMWHLQPEWELIKQSDGTWKVDGGRFLFCDHIAVAKVTSYYEYINSEYTAYTNPNVTITQSNCTNISLPNTISVSAALPEYPSSTSEKCTTVQFADSYDVYKDNGTWIKEITLSGDDSSGYSLTFDVSESTDNTHRVFALVGENIVHKNYNNSTTGTNDPRTSVYSLFPKESDNGWYGWQESWIQYDANGRPYVDANNNFVYHTAYTDDILNKNKVKFQIDLTLNGSSTSTNFDYSSDNIIFVDYTQLSDLDSDPYREFYKHFVGSSVAIADGATVSGGVETDGTDYAFKINTKINGTVHDTEAGKANWQCFVVRDVWVKGEFKIWSGWGGTMCRVADANNDKYLALWDNLNYGPYVTTANMETPITDIKAGIESDQAISLNSVNGGAASNYVTPGNGELTYYSRIILLYDQTNKNSYVMFIQEEASPAIKAFLEGDNSDQPYYIWNLQNTDNVSETVTGYTVTRYHVTDEGDINPVVVQTVTDPEKTALSDYTSGITYEEKISLNPGTYRYKIVVTFKDSNNNTTEEREAYSNQITVYGDAIAPEVRITQVVVLNEDGYKALGKSDYDATKTYYLTYGTNSDADYYMINSDATIEQVSASVALDVLSKPAYYVWDALLWVRALDYTAFTRYYDQAGITVSKDPSITLSVYEGADNTKTASTTGIKTSPFTATFTSGSTNKYIGTIVDRKGVLCSGNIKADMTYTLQDPSTGEDKAATKGDDTAPYSFVIGQPYSLDAYFKHVNDAFKDDSDSTPLKKAATTHASTNNLTVADNFKGYYEIRVASSISNATYTDKDDAITVTVPEDGIQYERHLNLNVTFYRPNISEAIYNQNEIVYTVSAKNDIPVGTATKYLLPNFSAYSLGGQYEDNSTEYKSEQQYTLNVNNTHPADCINTYFEIEKTVFIDTSTKNTLEATHSYGDSYGDLTLTKSNTPKSETSISSLGLGVNPGSTTGTNKWFLYSYNGFSHDMKSTEDSKEGTENKDEDVKVVSTKLFLLELSEGSNANYGKTLWIHDDENLATYHDSNVGYILNNVHYIADLTANGDNSPSITVTPIYICSSELSIEPTSDGGLAEYTTSGSVNVIRRSTTTGTAEVTYETSNGYIISATKDLTKATDVAVLEGTPVTVKKDNAPVLTGIESVAADDIYGEAVYYNLQGIQVSNPVHGQVYIRCQKGQNEKVVY